MHGLSWAVDSAWLTLFLSLPLSLFSAIWIKYLLTRHYLWIYCCPLYHNVFMQIAIFFLQIFGLISFMVWILSHSSHFQSVFRAFARVLFFFFLFFSPESSHCWYVICYSIVFPPIFLTLCSIFIFIFRSHFNRYNIVFLAFTYGIPMVIMIICYTVMGRELWGSQSIGENTERQTESVKSKKKVCEKHLL